MKLNLAQAQRARVESVRAAILKQQAAIAELRERLPRVQAEAEQRAKVLQELSAAADPADGRAVREISDATVHADLCRKLIGKVEQQIADAVEGLRPLCAQGDALWREVLGAVAGALEAEALAFHRRHTKLDADVRFAVSKSSAVAAVRGQLCKVWAQRPEIEEVIGNAVHQLGQLLGEHGGVEPFLFDGSASFTVSETQAE